MANSKNLFAETILNQLGGRKFIAMTGCANFVFDNETTTITMKLRRNNAKAGWLKIRLNVMDLYDMQFIAIKKDEVVVLVEKTGVYNDQLQTIFTDVTGLNTRLF